jgi:hypothetical protein
MIKYEEISSPKKILAFTNSYLIFYENELNNIKIFDSTKIQNIEYKELVQSNFSSAKIEGNGFLWEFEDDDAFFGKDTICEYSHDAIFDELITLSKILNNKKKLSIKKFSEVLTSLF